MSRSTGPDCRTCGEQITGGEFFVTWHRVTVFDPELHSEPRPRPGFQAYHLECLPGDVTDAERHTPGSFLQAMQR